MTGGQPPNRVRRRPLSVSRPLWFVLCLLLTLPASAAPIRLPQADGPPLELPRPASRLVTLSPHLTELVHAAGAGDRLVATVAFSDYPPQAAGLPRIGDAFRLDLERILLLRPDLVLAWDSGNPRPAVARLRSLGLSTWVTEIRRPEEIAGMLEWIGQATGTLPAARLAAEAIRARIRALQQAYAGQPEISYFYQVDARPLYTISGEHLIARSLQLCGGRNIFAGEGSLAPQVTHEAVIMADPDAMLAPALEAGGDPLAQWLAWPILGAVRNGALYRLPADQISRATPRMLDAVEKACRLLHRNTSGPQPRSADD